MKSKKKANTEEIHQDLKLIVKSSIIVFIGLFLSKLSTYVYRIIIARNFGPEVYGLFSLASITVGWFFAVSSLGLTQGILRFIPAYRGKKEYNKIRFVFKLSLILLIISTIISGILLFILSEVISINIFHNSSLIIFLKLFSFAIPIYTISNALLLTLRSFEKIFWYSFIFNILQNILKVVILILLVFLGFNLNAIIFSYLLSILGMLIVSYLVCRYTLPELFIKTDLTKHEKLIESKKFISYSWPLMFWTIITSIFYWIDSFFIGYFRGATEVGFYNVAVPIVALMGFFPEIFMQLFSPLINKEYSKGNLIIVKELSQQVVKWIFSFILPLFIIMFIFPEAVINLFFGQEYSLAANSLRILAFGGFISTIFSVSQELILITGRSKLILFNLIILSLIDIILNIILVPKYGIEGAAIASAITWIGLSIVLLIETWYFLSIIPFRRKMVRILLVSLIPTFLVFYSRKFIPINSVSLLLLGMFFVLLYFVLMFTTGCLDRNDLSIIKSFKEKIIRIKTNI